MNCVLWYGREGPSNGDIFVHVQTLFTDFVEVQHFFLLLLKAFTYLVPVSTTLVECGVQKKKVH